MDNLNKILTEDKKVDWEVFISRSQEYSPQFAFLVTVSQFPKNWVFKTSGVNFQTNYFKRVKNDYLWSVKEYTQLRNLLKKQGEKNPNFYLKIIKKAEKHSDNLVSWCEKINKQNYKSKTPKQLLELWVKHWQMLTRAACFLNIKHNLNRVLEESIIEDIESLLKNKNIDTEQASLYLEKLLTPSKKTLVTQANEKLKVLAKKSKLNQKEIKKWLQKYDWIDSFAWVGSPLSKKDVLKKINNIKKKKTESRVITDESRKIIKELGGAKDFATKVKALQTLLYLHTYELEGLFASRYWCKNFLTAIGKKINFSFDELTYMTFFEVTSALNGEKIDKKRILKRRKNKYAIIRIKKDLVVLEGDKFNKLQKSKQKITRVNEEIKGNVAYRGKATGLVKIIKTVADFKKFKIDDILVASMTTPDFTPYLSAAKAIVTDEGGITCHAAIVSRELSKPCIIGTKIATKVLKDGQKVEVDAERGIVRILK